MKSKEKLIQEIWEDYYTKLELLREERNRKFKVAREMKSEKKLMKGCNKAWISPLGRLYHCNENCLCPNCEGELKGRKEERERILKIIENYFETLQDEGNTIYFEIEREVIQKIKELEK